MPDLMFYVVWGLIGIATVFTVGLTLLAVFLRIRRNRKIKSGEIQDKPGFRLF